MYVDHEWGGDMCDRQRKSWLSQLRNTETFICFASTTLQAAAHRKVSLQSTAWVLRAHGHHYTARDVHSECDSYGLKAAIRRVRAGYILLHTSNELPRKQIQCVAPKSWGSLRIPLQTYTYTCEYASRMPPQSKVFNVACKAD